MRRSRGRRVLFLLLLLLLPACLGWLLSPEEAAENTGHSGRRILLKEGKTVEGEQFVLYMAAAQLPEGALPSNWPEAALQCQAVLARTYLYRALGEAREAEAENLQAAYWDERDMAAAWGAAYGECRARLWQAVLDTEGEVLKYEGQLICGVFHECSGGRTRDGSGTFPYLKSRESAEDRLADGYLWVKTRSRAEVCGAFGVEEAATLQIVARDTAGYVELLQAGNRTLSGEQAAEVLGLPSACFSWEVSKEALRIVCRGRGHGYGLSQQGARAKGEAGYTYREILAYYFPGTDLS